jgi:hydroxyethylthiazole kinase-like sugar kinase family protein
MPISKRTHQTAGYASNKTGSVWRQLHEGKHVYAFSRSLCTRFFCHRRVAAEKAEAKGPASLRLQVLDNLYCLEQESVEALCRIMHMRGLS